MNIRGLTPSLAALDPRYRTESKDNVRLENSPERDANGRRDREEAPQKRHLTEDEFQDALKILKDNPSLASANLQVRFEVQGDSRVVFIEDSTGKVIRRLTEADLWTVTRESEKPTGKILDKAG